MSVRETEDFYKGKIHIVSGIEPFSRYLWNKVVASQSSAPVCDFLQKIASEYPSLKVVKCDNGGAFRGKEMVDLCNELMLRQSFSFPYNPRSNGSIERSHSTVKHLFLRECRVERNRTGELLDIEKLDFILQKCILILNRSKSCATGKRPTDLFRKDIPRETPLKIFNKHIRKNASKNCIPEPVIVGTG